MQHLIIIGIGGFAREVYWHAQGSIGYGEDWDIKGFLDGDVKLAPEEYEKLDRPVLGDVFSYDIQEDDVFICAVGDGGLRKRLTEPIRTRGGTFINLIHKTAIIQGHVKMGVGNIFCPRTEANDHAEIGDFAIFNIGASIGHDTQVGDYVSFMGVCGLCGYARADDFSYFSTGACCLPHAVVEHHAVLGVGAVVFKRVKAGKKVFGNPAFPVE